MGHARVPLPACLLAVGAVVSPLGVGVALAKPTADFEWAPKPVLAGTSVTFTSTSTPDPSSPIKHTRWDFNDDDKFDANSPHGTAKATAPPPGTWKVTLRVEDREGGTDARTKEIKVEPSPSLPPPPNPPPSPPSNPPPSSPPNQPPPPLPNQRPYAAFAAVPGSPLVGDEVTFVSYSEDPDGTIAHQSWDLDGNGSFADATGSIATRSFSVPGEKTVTLRVTDDGGAASTRSLTLLVREGPAGSSTPASSSSNNQATTGSTPPPKPLTAPTPLPSLLSPFPIVRMVGSVTRAGTRIRLLTVSAPRGALASVRCRGRGCPVSRAERVVGRRPVRFSALERLVPARLVLEVLVRHGDRIGKFTRFKLRGDRRPRRADGCLWPGTTRMAPCPET